MDGQTDGQRQRDDVKEHRAANKSTADDSYASVFSPLDTVGVSEVMSLSSFLIVKQGNNGGDEVNDLSGWKKVYIGSAVSATVTVPAGSQGSTWRTARDLPTFYSTSTDGQLYIYSTSTDGQLYIYSTSTDILLYSTVPRIYQ